MYSCSLFDHSNECPTNHPSTPITNMSRLNEVTHVRTSTVYRRRFHLIFIVPKMCLCMGMRKNDTVFALLMMHDLNLVWPKAHVFANIVDASGCKYFLSPNSISMVQQENSDSIRIGAAGSLCPRR